ncbi:hypothetical protein [Streptomyces albireticuli]|uniref:Uncharacterized protein n=1 Tax=Streptomyces albireticuli TaxID=1940 RepID=A0A2A2DDL2_9ACTN|nr:hypothetical protein [Streptomyces albireticuli]MCD9144951.1 hypothetical protein [Streptomyces albireticuli]MCD9164377.1 hypothetical protein [Streptomyces albireticuli]MCD9194088.1 hypothetical protein [Streptomyces albireticuli]PAU49382.1 hypothetical protein CK936_07970 [Streptomyces albireticuli]
MTPYSLAFYMDVVASGTVLGAKPTDSPDQVAKALGPDFAENSFDEHSMWRDYGMVEFFWSRASADQSWAGHHFTLQVRRLAGSGGKIVNQSIRDRYGRFDRRLRFEKLRRLLERRGTPLLEIPDPSNAPNYRAYWQPDSQVSLSVIAAHEEFLTPGNLRIGDVYSITAPTTPEEVAWRRSRQR